MIQTLSIRKMRDADLTDVFQIESEANQFPWKFEHFSNSLKAGHHAWLFNDNSDNIVGYALVQMILDETHLLNICVHPSRQGKGFGRQILQYVIDFASDRKSNIVLLEVRESNQRAQNLYLQLGFNEMSIRKNYYPAKIGRENAVLMGLDLSLLRLFSNKK